jgi:hypothetical protein
VKLIYSNGNAFPRSVTAYARNIARDVRIICPRAQSFACEALLVKVSAPQLHASVWPDVAISCHWLVALRETDENELRSLRY